MLEGLAGILARAARQGITKVHEAGTGALFGASELDILHGLAASGRLSARITTAQLDTGARRGRRRACGQATATTW